MPALRFVLGDQLSRGISSLRGHEAGDVVLMVEVVEEATYVPHHPQKIAFLFSAMRHFAAELRQDGMAVDYVTLGQDGNTGSFTGELGRAIERHRPDHVVITEPGEHRVEEAIGSWGERYGLPVHVREDDRFLCSRAEFAAWAGGRKQLRMEWFYRVMRERSGYLMEEDGTPAGGQWNYDKDNRKALPHDIVLPERLRFPPDEVTREVLELVRRRFGNNFGDLEPFGWAVTRRDALHALDSFIDVCLPLFGDYQDAMKSGEGFLFHGLVSPYLNAGLLTAREVCDKAMEAWRDGAAPLNAVEGFVRQILGWREFIRGVYWLKCWAPTAACRPSTGPATPT